MTYGSGQNILSSDFNAYTNAIENIFLVGSGDRGYGQTDLQITSALSGYTAITALDWTKLSRMLLSCGQQTGTNLTGIYATPQAGLKIKAGTSLQAMLAFIDTNRLLAVGDARSVYPRLTTVTQNNSWNGIIEVTVTADFGTEDAARYFFNTGGELRVNLLHPNGTDNLNNSFRTLVQDSVGTIVFTAKEIRTVSSVRSGSGEGGYYALTESDRSILAQPNTGTNYSYGGLDNVQVFARCGGRKAERGGNGSTIAFRIALQCLGTQTGGVLASGTKVTVDVLKADKYVTGIITPNVTSTGFNLLSSGNTGDQTPPDAEQPGSPGQAQYPAGGIATFAVPQYSTITFDLRGSGGAEGSSLGSRNRPGTAKPVYAPPGADGRSATVNELTLVAYGGKGGGVYRKNEDLPGLTGASGGAANGDVNTIGAGAAGGANRYVANVDWLNGAPGGPGGRCLRTYIRGSIGAPTPGQSLTIVTPDGGYSDNLSPPAGADYDFFPGAPGSVGSINITWTNTQAGSVSYSTPGSYSFTVPDYTTLRFELSGGGGGQGGTVVQNIAPGQAQQGVTYPSIAGPDGGTGGVARVIGLSGWNPAAYGGSGGSTRFSAGNYSWSSVRGNDGIRYDGDPGSEGLGGGAKGGADGYKSTVGSGAGPGPDVDGGAGGDGALVVRTFSRGAPGSPVPGQVLQCAVPSGGAPGGVPNLALVYSKAGTNGWINISWT